MKKIILGLIVAGLSFNLWAQGGAMRGIQLQQQFMDVQNPNLVFVTEVTTKESRALAKVLEKREQELILRIENWVHNLKKETKLISHQISQKAKNKNPACVGLLGEQKDSTESVESNQDMILKKWNDQWNEIKAETVSSFSQEKDKLQIYKEFGYFGYHTYLKARKNLAKKIMAIQKKNLIQKAEEKWNKEWEKVKIEKLGNDLKNLSSSPQK